MSEETLVHIAAQSFVDWDPPVHSRWQLTVKRSLDLIVAIPVLILLMPVFAIAALLIKLETPGPVVYADKRLGKGGKVFNCLKLRTMFTGSEDSLEAYLESHPEAREHWAVYRKLPNDPRLTRVGRILRKTTLDELPQVINIIRGEMSIVGPRPFMLREAQELEPYMAGLLSMRPGMAGIWMAHGRNELTFEERIQLELKYIRRWSLKLDAVLFVKSLVAVLTARGAH